MQGGNSKGCVGFESYVSSSLDQYTHEQILLSTVRIFDPPHFLMLLHPYLLFTFWTSIVVNIPHKKINKYSNLPSALTWSCYCFVIIFPSLHTEIKKITSMSIKLGIKPVGMGRIYKLGSSSTEILQSLRLFTDSTYFYIFG